jgi:hypothetical protein
MCTVFPGTSALNLSDVNSKFCFIILYITVNMQIFCIEFLGVVMTHPHRNFDLIRCSGLLVVTMKLKAKYIFYTLLVLHSAKNNLNRR